ncbi:MAG TPA: glycerophosphodiester phosphodiesterase [Acidimicrobiales bacterium]|nr:glycerophosphodiester phosphodiesterase [Acidimicrobiales bacterium]
MTAVIAHRGCSEGFVENTLEAFGEARRLGADGVELDVRLTADGALAVHHDGVIPGQGPVSALEVRDLPPHVPLLGDALGVCEGMVVNVEIKNAPADPGHDPTEAVAALTAACIGEAGWTERVLVSSFQIGTLRAVQVADSRLALGALWPVLAEAKGALALAVDAGFRAVHPFVTTVTPDLVARAHGAGLAVNVWTVNAPGDLARCIGLGVDAVITDRLSEAMEAARPEGA